MNCNKEEWEGLPRITCPRCKNSFFTWAHDDHFKKGVIKTCTACLAKIEIADIKYVKRVLWRVSDKSENDKE